MLLTDETPNLSQNDDVHEQNDEEAHEQNEEIHEQKCEVYEKNNDYEQINTISTSLK